MPFNPAPNPDLLARSSLTRCLDVWLRELVGDTIESFIINGIAHGFKLVPDLSLVTPADCANYRSATDPNIKPLLTELFKE